jgi:agmatine deiminase
MIPDKETTKVYFSELLNKDSRFLDTFKVISDIMDSCNIEKEFLPNTKDIWARDYMPIQVSEDRFIEYRYDPDYLQGTRKGYRNMKTHPDIVCDKIKLKTVKTDIILDGGNVVKSKNCIVLTDKIVHENRLLFNKCDLLKQIIELFEVEKVVLIPWDTSEEFGHADGILRFINDSTVLVNNIYKSDKKLIGQLQLNGLDIEWLKYDVNKKDKRNWSYINFLQTKDIILIPKYGIDEDQQAFEQIKKHYSDYAKNDKVVQVDMTEIVRFKGALNCITWTIKN